MKTRTSSSGSCGYNNIEYKLVKGMGNKFNESIDIQLYLTWLGNVAKCYKWKLYNVVYQCLMIVSERYSKVSVLKLNTNSQ